MVEKRFEKLGMPDIERFENYLPTAFNSELTLLQKVNKIIFDLIETNKLTNEMVDYLNRFIETFDEKLYETIEDVLEVMLEDGRLADVIRVAISEEVIEARTDYLGHTYLNLKERLDVEKAEITTQLTQNALVDVSNYCGDLGTTTDNTQGILQAIEIVKKTNHKRLFFSPGVYAFSSKILIENIDEINIEFSPHAKLYDLGKNTGTTLGTKINPVGFIIRNVDRVSVHNLNHDCVVGPNTGSGYGQVLNIQDRTPQFSVEYAKKLSIEGGVIEGKQGSIISGGSLNDTNIMLDSYIRIYKCGDVDIHGVELADGIRGEYFGFYDCDNVLWYDCKHKQINTDTFWSFGKVIQCGDVEISKHDVTSSSTGSFIDVIARKIYIHDLHIDYIKGNFIDVSNEWGQFNMEMEEVHFVNCSSNGVGVTSVGSINEQIIKNLIIDNCKFAEDYGTNGAFMIPNSFENILIKNCDVKNVRYLIESRARPDKTTNKTTTVQNCTIRQVNNFNTTEIGVLGVVTFKNCYFELENNLILKDSNLYIEGVTNIGSLTNTPAQLIFKDCSFENGRYDIQVNTLFNNCNFNNLATNANYNMLKNAGATITCYNTKGYKYSKPTASYYPQYFVVDSTNVSEFGVVGEKYCIVGWKKISSDTTNNEGSDWLELRALTGN